MHEVSVAEARGALEEGLQALFRSGNDGRVISEEQASEDGNQDYREQIALAAFFLIITHILLAVDIDYGFVKFLLSAGLGRLAVSLRIVHEVLQSHLAFLETLAFTGIE